MENKKCYAFHREKLIRRIECEIKRMENWFGVGFPNLYKLVESDEKRVKSWTPSPQGIFTKKCPCCDTKLISKKKSIPDMNSLSRCVHGINIYFCPCCEYVYISSWSHMLLPILKELKRYLKEKKKEE